MGRRKGSLNKSTLAKMAAEAPLLSATQPPEESSFRQDAETSRLAACAPQPVSKTQTFLEYHASSGEKWRVEQGTDLLETFKLQPDALARWHDAMAPADRTWRLIRLRFGIAPLLAGKEDAEFLAPLSTERIAEKLSMEMSAVEAEIDSAKAFWLRWQTSQRSGVEPPKPEEIPRETDSQRYEVLKVHGFSDLVDDEEKLYVSSRISDLKHKLEDEEGRTIAQRAIRVELKIRRNDTISAKLEREAAAPTTDADKATGLRGDIKGYHDIGADLARQHLDLMKAMNATQEQNPSVQRKIAFKDCLGHLIRGIQEYESVGDNTIIDGVFTAAEIKILTRPMSLRPPQYRLDIVMIIRDAMRSQNLWNPDYEPPTIERGFYRRMRKALQDSLSAGENESGGMIEMEDEGGIGESLAETPSAPALPEPAGNGAGAAMPLGRPNFADASRSRPGEEFTTG